VGSIFAVCQSAAAGGAGAGIVSTAAGVGTGAVTGAATGLAFWWERNRRKVEKVEGKEKSKVAEKAKL